MEVTDVSTSIMRMNPPLLYIPLQPSISPQTLQHTLTVPFKPIQATQQCPFLRAGFATEEPCHHSRVSNIQKYSNSCSDDLVFLL